MSPDTLIASIVWIGLIGYFLVTFINDRVRKANKAFGNELAAIKKQIEEEKVEGRKEIDSEFAKLDKLMSQLDDALQNQEPKEVDGQVTEDHVGKEIEVRFRPTSEWHCRKLLRIDHSDRESYICAAPYPSPSSGKPVEVLWRHARPITELSEPTQPLNEQQKSPTDLTVGSKVEVTTDCPVLAWQKQKGVIDEWDFNDNVVVTLDKERISLHVRYLRDVEDHEFKIADLVNIQEDSKLYPIINITDIHYVLWGGHSGQTSKFVSKDKVKLCLPAKLRIQYKKGDKVRIKEYPNKNRIGSTVTVVSMLAAVCYVEDAEKHRFRVDRLELEHVYGAGNCEDHPQETRRRNVDEDGNIIFKPGDFAVVKDSYCFGHVGRCGVVQEYYESTKYCGFLTQPGQPMKISAKHLQLIVSIDDLARILSYDEMTQLCETGLVPHKDV